MQSRLVEAYGNCGEAGGTLFDFDFNVILNISSCIIWVRQDLYIVDISTIFYLLKAFEQ